MYKRLCTILKLCTLLSTELGINTMAVKLIAVSKRSDRNGKLYFTTFNGFRLSPSPAFPLQTLDMVATVMEAMAMASTQLPTIHMEVIALNTGVPKD